MTTGLLDGLSFEEACDVVRNEAQARLGADRRLAMYTETSRHNVLIGVARRGCFAATLVVPRDEYDGVALWQLFEEEAARA